MEIKKEQTRLDKLDSKSDKKISLVKGKEAELTKVYIEKVTRLEESMGVLTPEKKAEIIDKFIEAVHWDPKLPRPYLAEGDADLLAKAINLGFYAGITATATGFYGPQGRVLRLDIKDKTLNEKLSKFRFDNMRITNFEMETSGIYGLSKLFGHRAITINCIIANRFTGQYSKDYHQSMHQLIGMVMEEFV